MRSSRALVYQLCFAAVLIAGHRISAEDVPQAPLVVTKRSAENEAVYEALAKRRAWKFAETPLSAFRDELAKELGVTVAIDTHALDAEGTPPDQSFTLDLREASAKTTLDLLCRQLELDWTVRDGVLLITSTEGAQNNLEARVYDIAAIFPPFDDEGLEQPYDAESLIELITSVVAPTNWTDVGGVATIDEFRTGIARGLVLSQIVRDRELLEQLLRELGERRQALNAKHHEQGLQPPLVVAPDSQTAILAALETTGDWDLEKPSLADFLATLEAKTGLEFVLDSRQPDWIRNEQPLQIAGAFRSTKARAALDLVLSKYDLTWTIVDDVVFLTDADEADEFLSTRVYDVRDVVTLEGAAGKVLDVNFESLIELVTSTIDPTAWTDVGGTGAIQEFESGPLKVIVVSQTPQNHAAIAKLLDDLRALRAQTPAPPPNAIPAPAKPIEPVAPEVGESAPSSATPLPRDSGDMNDRSRRFAVKLYRELAAKEEGNVLVSPYSAFDALGMVFVGSRGETAAELAKALECTGVDQGNSPALFGRLRRGLLAHARFGKSELRIANRLWGQQGYPLLPEYIQALNSQFDSTPELVDFTQSVVAAERINEWATEQTAGKITDVVDPMEFDAETRFVLANAVYFKADWAKPFQGQSTLRGVFKTPDGERRVQYMNQRMRCQYAENDDLQLASLPYDGDRYSMVFLLPRLGKTPPQLEAKLTSERLHAWLASLRTCDVDLKIPKFRYETKLELNPILQSLGVTSMFDPDKADLSGIAAVALADELAISEIRQKTFIEVNEAGTEAAAVTTGGAFGGGGLGSRQPLRLASFHAERPFLFLIRDDESGVILFLGRITHPEFPDEPRGR